VNVISTSTLVSFSFVFLVYLMTSSSQTLRPMLHALLIPGSLSFLSVASNRRLKASSYRLIGAFMAKVGSHSRTITSRNIDCCCQSENLQFLDLSQNALDKKSVEYITSSLATAPNQGLVSLRLDDCSLRSAVLEVLGMYPEKHLILFSC
jgi:protein phosphatase 1 regulatory subunit 37